MKVRRSTDVALFAAWMTVFLFSAGISHGQKEKKKESVTEVFHVGYVGKGGVAETREALMALYGKVADDYNAKARREQADNPQIFEGEQVRVLKRMKKSDESGQYYMVAYNGGPSVLVLKGDTDLDPGSLSPALKITPSGEHTTEVTRRIRVKEKNAPEPALEVVDEKSSGAVTFFGIPIDTGGATTATSTPSTSGGGGPKFRTVSETNTLKKYTAVVSTDRRDGGPPEMSTELFVSQLKNGEMFNVSRAEQRRCQHCRGFGRVKTTKPVGFRDPDGKMACPACKAVGKINWNVTYRVVW